MTMSTSRQIAFKAAERCNARMQPGITQHPNQRHASFQVNLHAVTVAPPRITIIASRVTSKVATMPHCNDCIDLSILGGHYFACKIQDETKIG